MSYLLSNPGEVLTLLLQHLRMTGIALGMAIALAVPICHPGHPRALAQRCP
jgi:osmoprotectant transport system permease protein